MAIRTVAGQLTLLQALVVLASLVLTYTFFVAIYRLYFHPLAKYPGPRLASVSYLYETYYTYSPWHKGKYPFKTHELHLKYGPILRITPDDISVNDIDFYEEIYGRKEYSKDPWMYGTIGSGLDQSMFTSITSQVHRIRREPLQSFFSRGNVLKLESVVQEKVNSFISLAQKVANTSSGAFSFHYAIRSLSFDIITAIAFDRSFGLLEMEDMGHFYIQLQEEMLASWYLNMTVLSHIPFAAKLLMNLPTWIQSNEMLAMKRWQSFGLERLLEIETAPLREFEKRRGSKSAVFWHLLDPATKLKYKPSARTLMDEAFTLIGGGAETSAAALTQAVFQVGRNLEYQKKLVGELDNAFPDPEEPMTFAKLEKLPYLTAILKETLRITCGAIDRLRRMVPVETGANYKGAYFPPGTRISINAYDIHRTAEIFPDPHDFIIERWLGPESATKAHDKHFVPFSKGRRACIGTHLAWCELYISLASFISRFEVSLDNMKDSDMEVRNGYAFFPCVRGKDQKPLSLFIKERKR